MTGASWNTEGPRVRAGSLRGLCFLTLWRWSVNWLSVPWVPALDWGWVCCLWVPLRPGTQLVHIDGQ